MRKIYTLVATMMLFAFAWAQTPVTLTFTGQDINRRYVKLDSIVVHNITKDWYVTLCCWPDTVLNFSTLGVEDLEEQDFVHLHLSQNVPNPFDGITYVNLDVAEPGDVWLELTDINGRLVRSQHFTSDPGHYQFRVSLASAGVYFLTARKNGHTATVKMVNRGHGGTDNMELTDNVGRWQTDPIQLKVAYKGSRGLPYDVGDDMEYVGYTTFNGVAVQSQTLSQPLSTAFIVLPFNMSVIDGLPCPGDPTITDIDNNVYNTVMIGAQCWMKENLRTTRYSDETAIPVGTSRSNTPSRYAPNNDPDKVETYGYLYNWYAVMHEASASSANPSGVQGICPDKWHVPSDLEWTRLTDYVSQMSAFRCDSSSSGTVAKALAAKEGWMEHPSLCAVGNDTASNNASGFGALPAGNFIGSFNLFGYYSYFWSTTQGSSGYSYTRELAYHKSTVNRDDNIRSFGFSVRCVRDEIKPTVVTSHVSVISLDSVMCGGVVTEEGSATVTERGVCWSTSPNPTIADNYIPDADNGLGSFTVYITNIPIEATTTYYVRAYATNIAGTAYGDNEQFTILVYGAPVVETTPVHNFIANTATCGGQVYDEGGLPVTERGVCWSTSPDPTIDDNHIPVGSGLGLFTCTITELDPDTTYYVRAYAINELFTEYGVQRVFTLDYSCPGIPNPVDADGNVYNTVQVGDQCWMKENLRTTHFADNTIIPLGEANSNTQPYRYSANNNSANDSTYGYLYNWAAVMHGTGSSESNQGICPDGWHVPSDSEWTQLTNYVSAQNAYLCSNGIAKSLSSTAGWNNSTTNCVPGNNPSTNNSTGFAILPAGMFESGHNDFGTQGYLWSATENNDDEVWLRSFIYNQKAVNRQSKSKGDGFSVRCLRDNRDGLPCLGTATVTDADNNTYGTVQIGGQCWMAENLRVTKYADNTPIELGTDTNITVPYRYYVNNNSENVSTYGYLYNWAAAMHGAESSESNPSGVQGVCPDGWHVPSGAEWTQLTDYVSSQSAYLCSGGDAKALASTEGWSLSNETCSPGNNPSTNNATGFGLRPIGYRALNVYVMFGEAANIWTSTQVVNPSYDKLAYYGGVFSYCTKPTMNLKVCGEPVRCVRD